MGKAFDIIYAPKPKPTPRPTSHKSSPSHHQTSGWVYLGLIIVVSLMVADLSNGFGNDDQIIEKENNTNQSEQVLSETIEPNNEIIQETSESSNTNDEQNIKPNNQTSENATLEESSTQTQNASINKSSIKIRVLNGSKTSGAAANTKTKLASQGFTIDSIGNTRNPYSKSYIYYNINQREAAVLVQLALENQDIVLQENPSLTGDYDILVVIGSQRL